MERDFATVWEAVADTIGPAPAIVHGSRRVSWAELDDRAARLAAALTASGAGPGAKVAQYLLNAPEYAEVFFAALKQQMVPVNVNYRYLEEELRYLLTNSDTEVLVCHASLHRRVAAIRDQVPTLRRVLVVDDDAAAFAAVAPGERYEEVLAAHDPAPRTTRGDGARMMLYTGGTTGMPKGVVTPLQPLIDGYLAAIPPLLGLAPLGSAGDLVALMAERDRSTGQVAALVACPLMHGTGLNLGLLPFLTFGGRVVLLAGDRFDPAELWGLVEAEGVNYLTLVGDAFARPLLRELDHGPARDLSSLLGIISSGTMFSAEVKEGLLRHAPAMVIIDYMAATEGVMGFAVATADAPIVTGRFLPAPGVKVFTEDGREVEPGSGEAGVVAVSGAVPDGYYHDDAKTAATFREIDGVRYSMPGDWATVEADGQITLLGRGSQCINTGGEKVFPEEVEEVVKTHEAVEDCLVFGVPDERFGQRVVGVASLATGATAGPEEILATARTRLAPFKIPRSLVLVPHVPRAPNGKADYPAARELFGAP